MTDGHQQRGVATGMRNPLDHAPAEGSQAGILPSGGEGTRRGDGEGADRGGESGGPESRIIGFSVPGAPVGKGRPRFARQGAFVRAYTPEKTASYENLVKLAAREAMRGRAPIRGPVSLRIMAYVVPPASWSKKKRSFALHGLTRPQSKPDIDNMAKLCADALNGIAYDDDRQIVRLFAEKRYSSIPSMEVEVEAV